MSAFVCLRACVCACVQAHGSGANSDSSRMGLLSSTLAWGGGSGQGYQFKGSLMGGRQGGQTSLAALLAERREVDE